jgi:Flp pilus assembly pilin Flp
MQRLVTQIRLLLLDESGGEVLEYAIVTGLIVLGALSVIAQLGGKVLAKWTSLNSRL